MLACSCLIFWPSRRHWPESSEPSWADNGLGAALGGIKHQRPHRKHWVTADLLLLFIIHFVHCCIGTLLAVVPKARTVVYHAGNAAGRRSGLTLAFRALVLSVALAWMWRACDRALYLLQRCQRGFRSGGSYPSISTCCRWRYGRIIAGSNSWLQGLGWGFGVGVASGCRASAAGIFRAFDQHSVQGWGFWSSGSQVEVGGLGWTELGRSSSGFSVAKLTPVSSALATGIL
jgi:hypothetical protein